MEFKNSSGKLHVSRANSASNILDTNDQQPVRDIHPTIKVTNITKTQPNGHLKRSYLSINDDIDTIWKRNSELNLQSNNRDDDVITLPPPLTTTLRHNSTVANSCNNKNNYNSYHLGNNKNYDGSDFIINKKTFITNNGSGNSCTKTQAQNNYLLWVTPVAARYV